ncbi:MAG: histidine ammonia-lyase [Elusimicrobiaceae bacterium]|jgi:histidine ammonia-lyase|nr:histidine ammonia-lyase [Elusimicrobiaceae bacterium]MBT3954864.1 histidine ammonia-lyase [Elusimicrobiaceae bacterium]MBT4008389.1 histidine ammonia-lyase [Elusimicrobiaceae bacterium]MBT4402917.1 histidine ammonia-lyase [Elusimicrobiaceae bacterium]MBT4439853.1 histidine ammonia-lyase [Elusimicrobiaceae bacterium]
MFTLGKKPNLKDLYEVSALARKVQMTASTKASLKKYRSLMKDYVKNAGAVYGINTGFGDLASTVVPSKECKTLQFNLIRSHACGAGEPLSDEQARGILFLRANELCYLHSAVRPEVVQTIIEVLNKKVVPHIPSRGSVGASGDLAPSAHAGLVLIGEGKAKLIGDTKWQDTKSLFKKLKIKPLQLEEKEGLSLINGTQAMQSVGGLGLRKANFVFNASNLSAGLSLEAMKSSDSPFDIAIHNLKPHEGQIKTAKILTKLMAGSKIRNSHKNGDVRVQDSYSLRCIPQVHGAVYDTLKYTSQILNTEFGSATDNPLISVKNNKIKIISGGNFHGQAIALAWDFACTSLTTLGNISERRVFQIVSNSGGILPSMLAHKPGVESGWMISQYLTAGLASENKTLAHPASADSIPTCGNKEDFVSMGMWGALKLQQVIENVATIIAVELMASAQGLEFHKPLTPGKLNLKTYNIVRSLVKKTTKDVCLAGDIEIVKNAILNGKFEGVI